ncbi:MAG: methyltransferase domain-containing protein [bacterium]|nr:methyltransferase domain-containing protein [bacterium]
MDKKTIDTYNKLAKEYDEETKDFWNIFPNIFIRKFCENIPTKGRVLDVGSGPGRDALILQRAGLDVTCFDASEAMISMTKEKGFLSVLGDFNSIPFPDGSFDGVWSYTTLLHVPKSEVQTGLKEIHRVLKKDGIFGLGLIEGDTEGYRESSGVNLPRYFAYYTKEEVESLLKEVGFTPFHFETFKPGSKNYLHFLVRKG